MGFRSPYSCRPSYPRPKVVDIPYDPGDSEFLHVNSSYRKTIYPEDRKLRPELLPPAGVPNPIFYPYQRQNFEDLRYARAIATRRTHPSSQAALQFVHPRYELPLNDNRRFPRLYNDPRTYPRYYQWG
ncbi:hypothetical protein R1flu_012887 [Riccia fluitans]|uniref:Uncharacterized protein n=1 Tax=Riccia fluitans TaxID=41844 RepID=A0ABD1ZBV2_9MARC